MFSGRNRITSEDERIVEREQVGLIDVHVFLFLAVEPDFDRHIGPIFTAGDEVPGQGFDAEGRVARAVPVGRVPTV
ncbi:MAG: hypothetical protein B7Z55_16945, partial [Planctomycetales bacterium 12-60-4]